MSAPQDMLCAGGMLLDARRVATAAKQLGLTAVHGDSGTAMGLLTVVSLSWDPPPRCSVLCMALLQHMLSAKSRWSQAVTDPVLDRKLGPETRAVESPPEVWR